MVVQNLETKTKTNSYCLTKYISAKPTAAWWKDILVPTFTLSSFVLLYLSHSSSCYLASILYFHISMLHAPSRCQPSLPSSQSPKLGLSLCFSILQFLNQYPPHWNLKHYCQWSNPWVSLGVRNLTGRQKKMNLEKIEVDSSLRWAEVSLMLFKLCEGDNKEQGWTADRSRTSVLQ